MVPAKRLLPWLVGPGGECGSAHGRRGCAEVQAVPGSGQEILPGYQGGHGICAGGEAGDVLDLSPG